MEKYLLVILVSTALATARGARQGQKFEYTKQAEFDADGNIYVSSDEGKLIKMAAAGHCMEARSAPDNQTVGCSVSRGGSKPEEFMQSLRLEIYLRNLPGSNPSRPRQH